MPLPRLPLPRRTGQLLLAMALLHYLVGASLGLSVDEAHYALYAAHPAWSYFDHPPLVGWLQWPLVALQAPTALLRLLPEALWLGSAALAYRLAQRLQPAHEHGDAGFWTVLLLALTPLLHLLGIGLLPDTLLLFFSLLLMTLALQLQEPAALRRLGPWLALGLTLGLAGLSKYTAILAALALAGYLLQLHGAALLRNYRVWVALVLALLLVTPVLLWNLQNDWISLRYQAAHGAGGHWQLLDLLRFALLQLLVYGPLLLWGLRGPVRAGTAGLRAFFLLPFAVLALMAGGGSSLPHWTAPAWACLAPFAGVALAGTHGRVVRLLALLQALCCALALGLMLSAGQPLLHNMQGQGNSQAPSNPFADFYGWDAAGSRALSLAAQEGLSSVSVQNWTLASRLGWYARPLPVHVLEDRFDQFTLWAGALAPGADTLLVDWSQLAYTLPLGAHGFADCRLLATQDVQRLGAPVAQFRFYACHRWSGQAQPRLQELP